jgi:hypothetical protein
MKRPHKFAAGLGAGMLLLILLAVARGSSTSKAPAPARPAGPFEVGIPTAQEIRAMLGVYGERVETAERELKELRTAVDGTRKGIEEAERRQSGALERLARDLVPPPTKPAPPAPPPLPRFRSLDFGKAQGRALQLPAGSFGEATLLTGVFAPVKGEPLPVLLRLDAALVGPQKSRIPLSGAFLVGKAQGDANSRRATVQLETLSAVAPGGKAVEARVNGWIVDEDGIQGLSGLHVWRAEEIVALTSFAGALSGGAEAAAARETAVQATPLGGSQTAVTGDPWKFAGYRALGSGFGKLGETVAERASEIVPAVYVANGRRVTVAFIGGATLEGYAVPEPPPQAFDGLDD